MTADLSPVRHVAGWEELPVLSGMDEVNWFALLAMLSVLGWQLGVRLGAGSAVSARAAIATAAVAMVVMTYLVKHPSVAVQVLPVGVMARIEGVAVVPAFALMMGVAWSRSLRPRQRAVVAWGLLMGGVYFVHGGMWMLQATPSEVMASDITGKDVMQSQDYTCVPAASASALRRLGVLASEAEMAELTRTRPGTGSTTVRALHGLNLKLADANSPWRAHLIEVLPENVRTLPTPAITPLRYESTRRHMVQIVGFTRNGVHVSDPVDGRLILPEHEFARLFTGEVIVFLAQQ